jgi:hypothetical protein
MRPSRREFLKWASASGITLSLSRLGSAEAAGVASGSRELESRSQ